MAVEGQRDLYLKNLLLKISLKWRKMLIFGIVFALLFDGVGVYKSYKNNRLKFEQETQTEINLDEYSNGLSSIEKQHVERVYKTYEKGEKLYNQLYDYLNDYVYISIDGNRVPTTNLLYKVENCSQIEQIATYLNVTIVTDSWYGEIVDDLQWDTEAKNLYGIIKMVNVVDDDQYQVVNSEDLNEKYLKIKVIGKDKESSQYIADKLKNDIKTNATKIAKEMGGMKLHFITSSYSEECDSNVFSSQQGAIEKMNSSNNYLLNAMNLLNAQQKNYFEALVRNKKLQEDMDLHQDEQKEEIATQSPSMQNVSLIHVKYILLGFCIGIMLVAFYYCAMYIFSRCLHLSDEIKDKFEIPILGELNTTEAQKDKDPITKLLYRIFNGTSPEFSEEECINMICAAIGTAIRKNNMKKIHITGASTTSRAKKFYKVLKESLVNTGANITIGNSIAYDSVSYEEMTEADGVVFVEEVDKSIYKDIIHEVEVSKNYHVENIGTVILM